MKSIIKEEKEKFFIEIFIFFNFQNINYTQILKHIYFHI